MPPSKRPADAKGMKSLSFFFDKKPTSKSSTTIAATATAKNQAKAVVMATPKPTSFSKKQEENPKTPETEASSLGEDSDVEIQTTSPVVASSKKKTTSSTISASKSKARASMVQKKRKVIIDSDEEDDEEEEKKCEDPAPNTSAAAKEPPRKKAAVPNGKATLPKQTTKEMSNTKPAALSKITIKKPASTPVPAKTTNHTKTANNKTNKAASAASAWGALLNGSFKTPDKKKSNNKRKKSTNSEEDEGAGTAQMRSILKAPYSDGDDLPILSEPQEFFDDMIQNQLCNNGTRPNILLPLLETLASRGPLKIATMCSGTESPVLALDMIVNSIESFCQTQGIRMENGNGDGSVNIRLKHVFSCEIEPAKQAYIERNFQPPLLFRDIRELGDDQARTAYGALVDVPNTPGCVDILVAGTSCVDYSNLNTKKKQMEAGGESGQTFQGMLKWIDKAQPSIVILENVVGAPWEKKIEIMESYGYAATWMRVDSKKYYIPHTRQRGYLFAVRQDPKKKMVDQKRLKGWEATMKKLERPASAPLDALMLPNDDPRVLRGRARLTQESSSGGDAGDSRAGRTDWSKCEARHVRA